ncbi:Mu transposase C-terminal domain-containing protein [Streptomyces sp. NBC_00154]|uniref:Mu transposase C-terminal domain-containing protein n=1 Tax=Streptomyces sp. NBC_00154 TaxID=2975670 RepID=UPI00224F193E|nr:Mu transposase C-terminal domain-containing protein [Streptomyces sp. NBC_00154]MCX5318057.1 Mu transposase C-terminal domain-containing protein [Streptomyces sp. NBC_00154]MCX5318156.1 Mu transposase C-terminal domain-containing protein [Streptomyces sp. NBC_00154]
MDGQPLAPPEDPAGVLGEESLTALRAPAVRRLLALRAERRLSREHVRLAGECLGVSERTVWRWLAEASLSPDAAIRPGERSGDRFEITREIRVLLAYWHGNASAVHRQLMERAAAEGGSVRVQASGTAESVPPDPVTVPGGAALSQVPLLDPVPSLSTFLRAVRRDLTAGERAGLAAGPDAARAHDVFGKRAASWRNHVWETDHVQAPLLVDADGDLVRPWVTWFIDTATKVITGIAVTPGVPSRASVLVALRAAVLREDPYGPAGGTPEQVRVDRGKDFLSRTVTTAFGTMGVTVKDLPAYSPHLKGTVENLNRAVDRMLFAALPGYTLTSTKPRSGRRSKAAGRKPETSGAMSFQDFTAEVLAWTHWWNTEHRPQALSGRTPLEAWQADPTPVTDVPAADLWTFTLEDDGRPRRLTSHGVRWRGRTYIAPWMTGQAGRTVTVRYMPHHNHEIDICDASGRYLGPAHLADAATLEQLQALRTARAERARRLRAEVKAAEMLRRQRFAPVTTAGPAQRLGALTSAQAGRELAAVEHTDASKLALPDLIPPAAPPADWRTPPSLAPWTTPGRPAPVPSEPAPDGPAAQTDEDGDAS